MATQGSKHFEQGLSVFNAILVQRRSRRWLESKFLQVWTPKWTPRDLFRDVEAREPFS